MMNEFTYEVKELTKRQREVLAYLVKRKRWPPTMRELGTHFSINFQAAQQHLLTLEDKGYIERDKYKARMIKVLREG